MALQALASRPEELCLNADLKLYRCPYTDQVWDVSAAPACFTES